MLAHASSTTSSGRRSSGWRRRRSRSMTTSTRSTPRPAGRPAATSSSAARRCGCSASPPPASPCLRATSPPGTTSRRSRATDRLVDRLVDAGAIHPHPTDGAVHAGRRHRRRAGARARRVGARRDRPLLPRRRRRHRRRRRVRSAGRRRRRARGCCGCGRTPGRPSPATPGSAPPHTPLVAFVDTDVRLEPGWLDRCSPTSPTTASASSRPRVASAPGAGPVAGYEQGHSPLDLGPEPGRIAPGTRLSYVPAAALVVRTEALRAIGGFDRAAALRRGRRRRLAARRGRVALPLRAGGGRPPPAARARGAASSPSASRYGSSAAPLAKRHPGALAPVRISGWSGAAWGLLAAGQPVAALAARRRHGGRPRAQAARRAGQRVAAARRARATSTPGACSPTPPAGPGGRCSSPARVVSPRVRRLAAMAAVPALLGGGIPRLVDDLAYGVGVWKGVLAERGDRARCARASRRGRRRQPVDGSSRRAVTRSSGDGSSANSARRYRRRGRR